MRIRVKPLAQNRKDFATQPLHPHRRGWLQAAFSQPLTSRVTPSSQFDGPTINCLSSDLRSLLRSRIDSGFLTHATGWSNGDSNYDGVINGSDYTLIDNTFNTQGASLAADTASVTSQIAAVSSVPEPTALGLLALGAMYCRRRRS
jgi:hypothetical protein